MGQVFAMHGVVPGAEPTRFVTRFLSDTDEFSGFLAGKTFVPLADALLGNGNALTVDDATRAAAEACRMVRGAGQPVTLFVNPGQVESGQPYWFVLLKVLCDGLRETEYPFKGVRYPAATLRDRIRLRQAVREPISRIPDEAGRIAAVRELAESWKLAPPIVPAHGATLSLADLKELVGLGVDIQNHGWSHANHGALSPAESASEVRRGREWLRDHLGGDPAIFAVPFGAPLPAAEAAAECSHWLTLTDTHPPGAIQEGVWNRKDLTLYRPAEPVADGRTSGGTGRSVWTLPGFFRRFLRR
jgi:peptidoglycan/xylan/chitin deacetylase (PgdA/CDA1 family)